MKTCELANARNILNVESTLRLVGLLRITDHHLDQHFSGKCELPGSDVLTKNPAIGAATAEKRLTVGCEVHCNDLSFRCRSGKGHFHVTRSNSIKQNKQHNNTTTRHRQPFALAKTNL